MTKAEERKKKKAIAEAIAIRYGKGKHAPKDAPVLTARLIERMKKEGHINIIEEVEKEGI